MARKKYKLIEGQPVLVVIDIQGGASEDDTPSPIPFMSDYQERMDRAPALIEKARECNIPVVFLQEAHRRDLIDFGRELDGAESDEGITRGYADLYWWAHRCLCTLLICRWAST